MKNLKFSNLLDSKGLWFLILAGFLFSSATLTFLNGGKDLRVGLYGVEEARHGRSPYENPTDPSRPLFRYAPGFAFLQSPFLMRAVMTGPFRFKYMKASIAAWYFVDLIALLLIGKLSLDLLSTLDAESIRNLKIAFVLSLPWIIYEVINGQNKIVSLLFIMSSLFFFERNKLFWSTFFFNLAITVYVPLAAFMLFFLLRYKKNYLINFFMTAGLVFILLPSLLWGFHHNFYLLKDWFIRCLKPFLFAHSYETYVDLRKTSQALPSVVGRWFVTGLAPHQYAYHWNPFYIHILIKSLSFLMVFFTAVATWKSRFRAASKGLVYSLFLILALLLPEYCLCYTWAWFFFIYFAVFHYVNLPQTSVFHKKLLLLATALLVISTTLFSFNFFQNLSVLFWATLWFWATLIFILMSEKNTEFDIKYGT